MFEEVDFEEHFSKLPEFTPTTTPSNFTNSTNFQNVLPDGGDTTNGMGGAHPQDENTPVSPITSNRQILDRRRNLVVQLFDQHGFYPPDNVTVAFQQVHKDLFATKWNLQVKIREVRQNLMKKGKVSAER